MERQKQQIQQHSDTELSAAVKIEMIDPGKKKFVDAGWGTVSLSVEGFRLTGSIRNKAVFLSVPIGNTPTLPFAPGKHFEIQDGGIIYRCVPEDGRMVMKLINTLKAFHEYHRSLRSRIGTKAAT